MAEQLSRNEFERFEKDLKQMLDLKFDFINENIGKIDKKMDTIFSYQQEVVKDVAKINQKADKANERLDRVEDDLTGIKVALDGDNENPGLKDKVRNFEEYLKTKKKYWQRFVYAMISLVVMVVGGYFLGRFIEKLMGQ